MLMRGYFNFRPKSKTTFSFANSTSCHMMPRAILQILRSFSYFANLSYVVAHKCLVKSLLLKISQNSVLASAFNFIKKEALALVFSCKFCEIFKKTFFTEHRWLLLLITEKYEKRVKYLSILHEAN